MRGKSIVRKKLYQYTDVCAFLKSPAYVMWLLVVVVSGVPRWEFARTSQRSMEKSNVQIEGGGKSRNLTKTTTVGLGA